MNLTKRLRIVILFPLVLSFVTGPGLIAEERQHRPISFVHESYDTPALALLREEFSFDEYARRGASELEQMYRLKNWVFQNVDFKHNYEIGELRNALKILRLGQNGLTFHCSHFAAVYMQCAVSMGWTARYFFLRNIKAEEHAANEIWSNELKKWIFIDVTWNVHIEKDGVPLSILEIRREWIRNDGKDVVYVFGDGTNERRYTYKDFPVERSDNNAWIWWPLDEIFITYSYEVALIGRNDFFTKEVGEGEYEFWQTIYIIKDEINSGDKEWSLRRRTDVDDMRALYHDVNRVDIGYTRLDKRTLRVRLDAFGPYNYTPNFGQFLVKENGKDWKRADAQFDWKLKRRANRLEARIVNRFGVLGPITVLELP
jgi:hypothetical protein